MERFITKGLNMKLVSSLLVLAIVGGGVPDAAVAAGQMAGPDLGVLVATPDATPKPDYILNVCTEKPSTGNPASAYHAVDPAGMLVSYIGNYVEKRWIEPSAVKNVTLLQGATVGKITSVVDNTGRPWYRYDAPANYEGNDRAVFMAEYQGKRYKIIVDIVVTIVVDETTSQCSPPKLIKVTKPSSGDSGFGAGYDLTSVADLVLIKEIYGTLHHLFG